MKKIYLPTTASNVVVLIRERTLQFVVQAYIAGPQNVDLQETGPLWLKFEEALSNYEDNKRLDPSEQLLFHASVFFYFHE